MLMVGILCCIHREYTVLMVGMLYSWKVHCVDGKYAVLMVGIQC